MKGRIEPILLTVILLVLVAGGVKGIVTDSNLLYFSADNYTASGTNLVTGKLLLTVDGVVNGAVDINDTSPLYFNDVTAYDETSGTICIWANADDWSPGSWDYIVDIRNSGNLNVIGFHLQNNNQDMLYRFRGNNIETSVTKDMTGITGWHHLCMTYDTVADEMKAYFDGAQEGVTQTAETWSAVANENGIGYWQGGSTNYFPGLVDEFGAWSSVLTITQIQELYNSGNGVASESVDPSNLVLSANMDYAYDFSENSNHGEMNIDLIDTGKLDSAFRFDGVDNVVNYTEGILDSQTAYSTSFWYYHTDNTAAEVQGIVGEIRLNANYNKYGCLFDNRGGASKTKALRCSVSDGTDDYIYSVDNFFNEANNVWHHVVLTWTANDYMHLYKDGAWQGRYATPNADFITTNFVQAGIGRSAYVSDGFWNGRLDEIGIWNRNITEAEISQLYNSGSGYNPYLDPNLEIIDIIALNLFNLSYESTFNVTISNSTISYFFATTNGTIITNITNNASDLYNLTVEGLNYITETYLNVNGTDTEVNITQAWVNVNATEIHTSNYLQNITIETAYHNRTTTTNNISFPSNIGNFSWNFKNEQSYYNVSSLNFNVDGHYENFTITNLFDTDMSFTNNLTSQAIYPTCTYGSGSYTLSQANTYHATEQGVGNNVSCTLLWFQPLTFSIENTTLPQNLSIAMQPNQLNIIFTEETKGWVETIDCVNEECYNFTNTSVIIVAENISIGYVVVRFNNDTSGNWQQVFTYYNNQTTHVKEYIKIITPDLVQQIKVTGDTTPLENARVCADELGTNPETNATEWLTVFCDYTDVDGYASVLINDENNYKFCVQAEGYIPQCVMEYIPPSNANIFIIDMEESDTTEGYNYIMSSCPNVVLTNETCTVEVVTFKPYSAICINYTSVLGTTESCTSDSSSKSYSFIINDAITWANFSVYLDGTLEQTLSTEKQYINAVANLTWDIQANSTSYTDKLQSDTEYLALFYIIVFAFGVVLSYVFDKMFNGYGIYGGAVFFGVVALSGFPVLWFGAIPSALHLIMKILMPYFK